MTATALEELLRSLDPIELKPGDVLLRQGEASEAAYFLDRGSMLVYAETPYGPVSLSTLRAPRLIGEIGAFSGLARTASVSAASHARLFRIERARLLELGRNSPDLLLSAIQQMGEQIDSFNKAMALYTNALAALERREFDEGILADLKSPTPQLVEFSAAFRRFADQIASKRRRQDEMAAAALIQQSLLPKEPLAGLAEDVVEIRARMRPAREVGGDFYDFFMLDSERLALVVGDVCGKGAPASLFMAVAATVLRLVAREEEGPAPAIARANALLCRDNAASMFATAFFAVLNLSSGRLDYCNCGHNAPVLLPARGAPRRLAATGLPLAVFAEQSAAQASVRLDPGDRLFLFTDGFTEAMNPRAEEFGEPSFVEALLRRRDSSLGEIVSGLFAAVDEFAQGEEQSDDITCLAVRRGLTRR